MTSAVPLDPVALTKALVAIDSRNPDLVPDGPGEMECARYLAGVLSTWGFAVSLQEVSPGRPNVIARIGPTARHPLVLNGHLDVVSVTGMTHAPFSGDTVDGNIFGRGSSDMKAGVASMCVAAARAAARGSLASEIIITAVCDEEYASIGTAALLAEGLRAEGAIITEPTQLAICPAHKGFVWIEVNFEGVAAHGSRFDVGVDAVKHAGLLLAELDRFERNTLATRTHPLLSRPSMHASTITGGSGWSTYAESCKLEIERRTLPGETAEQALGEVQALMAKLAAENPTFVAHAQIVGAQPPLDLAVDSPLAVAVAKAATDAGLRGTVSGLSCWTDAALFSRAGIPALCFGPGDLSRAHSAREWVETSEVERATDVLENICAAWGRADS